MHEQKIVCAALKLEDGLIVTGVRHHDMLMNNVLRELSPWKPKEQGFVDNHGEFFGREEALKIAIAAKQLEPKTGNQDCTQLYSEDLY